MTKARPPIDRWDYQMTPPAGQNSTVAKVKRVLISGAMPVPLRGRTSAVPGASVAMTSVPDASPIAAGAKDTVTAQLCPGSIVVQVCATLKSPEGVMRLMLIRT
jgi:hypothetical protein